jgi:hypothetical protein
LSLIRALCAPAQRFPANRGTSCNLRLPEHLCLVPDQRILADARVTPYHRLSPNPGPFPDPCRSGDARFAAYPHISLDSRVSLNSRVVRDAGGATNPRGPFLREIVFAFDVAAKVSCLYIAESAQGAHAK